MNIVRNLTDIINNEALLYAMYTIENRAIPSVIDGLKPVQRFIMCSALKKAKSDPAVWHKVTSVAGNVSELGYNHAETSAQDAAALMANDWNNNLPLLDGNGNFGSRLVQTAAQSRYIKCRVSENFYKYTKDLDIAPAHKENDHVPPMYYLPTIPLVLLNGVYGIGTGFSTSILPHSLASVVECTKLALKGELKQGPQVQFPLFNGTIKEIEPNKYELHGTYKLISKTQLEITEVPYKYERDAYIEVLDELEDANKITYEDNCGEHGFGFKIKLKKEFGLPDDETKRHNYILKEFKLIQPVSQSLYTLDAEGKLKYFENTVDLINYFVDIRKQFVQLRIEKNIKDYEDKLKLAVAKAMFISKVLNEEIIIKNKSKKDLHSEIVALGDRFAPYATQLLNLNVYHMTKDESLKLVEAAKELKNTLEYWKHTNVITEYMKDLS